MKILIVVHSVAWKGGGAFFHALHIAKGLKKKGNNVDIMCTSEKSYFCIIKKKIDGINLIQFPDLFWGQARNGWDLYNTFRRIIFLLKERYDIVHLLDTRPVVIFPGLFAQFFWKSKLIIEWLDWFGRGGTANERKKIIRFFMEPLETFFEENFRKYADASIGLGNPLTKRAVEFAPSKPVITITHGCDTEFIYTLDLAKVREELNLKKDAFYIGYTGRMREDVIARLVKLVKYLNYKLKYKNIYIILIGNHALDVEKFIDKEVKKYFIKTCWIEYKLINKFMSACDILILPFDSNSIARNCIWPSKINDYLSVGRPIISTRLEVLKDLFENQKIGFMVNDNIEKLAQVCIKLFDDKNLANELGNNARKLAVTKYNWDIIVEKINKFYLEIL